MLAIRTNNMTYQQLKWLGSFPGGMGTGGAVTGANKVQRALFALFVESAQIFADDAQSHQLYSGKK